MSIIDTLITDRKASQAERVERISSIRWDDMTLYQKQEWLYGEAEDPLYWQDGEVMRCKDGALYIHNADGTNKGAYNWKDLNRVCAAMEYLNQRFTAAGYILDYERVTPAQNRSEWQIDDIPTKEQAERYLKNAQSIRSIRAALATLKTTPALPTKMEDLTTDGANAIEKVLVDLEALLTESEKVFIRAGMPWAVSGAPGIYTVN